MVNFHRASTNALQSDTRLHVNFDHLRHGNVYLDKLFGDVYLEILRVGDTNPLIRIPYWQSYGLRSPEDVSLEGRNLSFVDLIRKLSPRTVSLAKDGKPIVLGRVFANLRNDKHSSTRATVRLSEEALGNKKDADAEPWNKTYQQAQLTGLPVVLDRNQILVPKSHVIYESRRDFSNLYSTECCAFSVQTGASSREVYIAAELLTGEKHLTVGIKPESIPEEIAAHNVGASCRFRVVGVRVTNSELIATGEYRCGTFQSAPYDWAVSLDQLPDWIK